MKPRHAKQNKHIPNIIDNADFCPVFLPEIRFVCLKFKRKIDDKK
jgi:hypothetical protein